MAEEFVSRRFKAIVLALAIPTFAIPVGGLGWEIACMETAGTNIEKNNTFDIAIYTVKAFTAVKKDDKYLLQVYGFIAEDFNTSVFSSLSYEIDKETYKIINEAIIDVHFEYDSSGQIINAENIEQGFVNAGFKVLKAYRKLAEITKNQQPVEIEKYSANEMATTSAQKFAPVEVEFSYTSEDGKVNYNKKYGGIDVVMPEI